MILTKSEYETLNSFQELEEKLILFNGGKNYGQIVFMAGGAGSGGSGNPHGGPGGNGKSVTPVFGSSPQPFYGPTNGTYAGGGGGGDDASSGGGAG